MDPRRSTWATTTTTTTRSPSSSRFPSRTLDVTGTPWPRFALLKRSKHHTKLNLSSSSPLASSPKTALMMATPRR